jgi:predicted DNA-binding protein YlxM (UPF0122 family)
MSNIFNALPATVQQKNLLYDFYGGLLTEKQRAFFIMHYMDDLSLAEIGEHSGITPQAVADLLKRANRLLDGYEAKLGLVEKFKRQGEILKKIYELTDNSEIRDLVSEMVL